MKKRKWLYPVLIILVLAVYFVYQAAGSVLNDSEAPIIQMSSEIIEISVMDSDAQLLQGITAVDDTDGDVTQSLLVENIRLIDDNGTIRVRYAAFDKSGNVAKAAREMRYSDYQGPKFSLKQPLVFIQNRNFDVMDEIKATDYFDGDISHRIKATSNDDASIAAVGKHDVTFRVSNSLGDTAELVLPVEVHGNWTYDGSLILTDYLIYLNKGDSFDAKQYLHSFDVNMNQISLANGLPEHFSLQTSGSVNTQEPGVYEVTYRLTQVIPNDNNAGFSQQYEGYSKLIVVVEG